MADKDKAIETYIEFCNAIQVPNMGRLRIKSDEFLFDFGVLIISPMIEDMQIVEVREMINFLLDYEHFDECSDLLERINRARGHNSKQVQIGINILNQS